jgi:hypothetical protein
MASVEGSRNTATNTTAIRAETIRKSIPPELLRRRNYPRSRR